MRARRALAAYLALALAAWAGVGAYMGSEVSGGLPAPEPSVITDTRTVDAPPGKVWAAMSDPASWALLPAVERAERVPGSDPPAVELELREWLISIDVRAEHEVRPGYQQLRVVGGYLDGATVTQTFAPSGSGTEVRTAAELDLRALRLVSDAPEDLARDRLEAALSELSDLARG